MKSALLILALAVLSGCNDYYTAQVCTQDKRVDVPYFDGGYRLKIQDTNFKFLRGPVTLIHEGLGTYSFETQDNNGNRQKGTVYTCQVSSRTFLEGEVRDDQAQHIGWSAMELVNMPRGFLFQPVAFDTEHLDQDKIPYTIKDPCTGTFAAKFEGTKAYSKLFSTFSSGRGSSKCLEVDNANLTPETFVRQLEAVSFAMPLFLD